MIDFILMILCGIILAFAGTNFSKSQWVLVFVFLGFMLIAGDNGINGPQKGIINFIILVSTWFFTLKIKEHRAKKIAP